MKFKIVLFFIALTLLSCSQKQNSKKEKPVLKIEKKEFQVLLDSAKVNGTILIFDKQGNKFYSNNFQEAKQSYLPASTFKIPNSIIGLETGILKDEQTIFKWDGNDRAFSIWENDLNLKDAFQKSCVPCYQELARKIGTKRMKENLKKLQFGEMNVNNENIDNFWLIGKSKINPFQQIDFLSRFYENHLSILKSTTEIVKRIMKIKTTESYTLSGKTGWIVNGEKDIGWFVGYIEREKKVFYFATKITPKKSNMSRNEFAPIRKKITILALKELKIIE